MDNNKCKSVTTSVPSISIKFHANAEQLEEIHTDDDESTASTCTGGSTDKRVSDRSRSPIPSSTPPVTNINEPECSPLKYLPKLVKRSTSIDVSSSLSQQQEKQITDASPPSSDPWRFFSDIKGKITKSVEEKITEIKSRNQEEGSPHHKQKVTELLKATKDSKENSSVSDSEDLSESSISRTCGIISTTEGVEMSSDEDTPSIEKEKREERPVSPAPAPKTTTSLRQRFRFLRGGGGHKGVAAAAAEAETTSTGTVRVNDLSKLYNINAEKVEQVLPEDDQDDDVNGAGAEGVESAVDALDETASFNSDHRDISVHQKVSNESILKAVAEKYDNIEVDQQENVVMVKEVSGKDIREDFVLRRDDKARTLFAPTGFVDLRVRPAAAVVTPNTNNNYLCYAAVVASICIYFLIYRFCPFFCGLALGLMLSFLVFEVYMKLHPIVGNIPSKETIATRRSDSNRILEIQAVKEYQPLLKYEGWVNEYPEAYDPETYHISKTQSVWVRLQGNLLRLSHAKNHKVGKRAMWNEPTAPEGKAPAAFTHHRIYNMIGAKVRLLPVGLAKKRHWSKKYPICITLAKDQLYFDNLVKTDTTEKDKCDDKENKEKEKDKEKLLSVSPKERRSFGRFRKKDYSSLAQRFSKLTEDEDVDLDSDSRASTPSADVSDFAEFPPIPDEESSNQNKSPNIDSLNEEWSLCSPTKEEASSTELKIYLFGRTDREKEDWFRRLTTATHKEEAIRGIGGDDDDDLDDPPNNRAQQANTDLEYIKFMSSFKPPKISPKHGQEKSGKSNQDSATSEERQEERGSGSDGATVRPDLDIDVLWLNTLIGRVLFDCMRDETFIQRVKERIQRKLSTIKLPNFIEELLIPELSLGRTSPIIRKAGKPVLDERGIWIDLDISYEGDVLLTLQTKLNLMRLKNPQAYEKSVEKVRSAIYHSDVDDSAESSSDDEGSAQEIPTSQPPGGETSGPGGSGGSSPTVATSSGGGGKKFIRMVDRLAESKFFQAATENRYIKKAMEGVSTELRLTVEVKSLTGTVVLNVPPPPSDRIWVGFRPLPDIVLSARPIVGERNISYFMVTSWIEKKLLQEFQKILVVPNMEDFIIPVMNPKLPE